MTAPTLVVGPSWVGDMIMAQSLFKQLQIDTQGPIDVLAPPWSLPVLARMPEVRRGIALPIGHGELGLGTRRRIGRSLRAEGYRQAIVLPRSAKAALVPWHANVPQRTGFRGEMRFGLINDIRPFDRSVLDQTVKRFVALGLKRNQPLPASLPTPKLLSDANEQRAVHDALGLQSDQPTIALLPGAEYGPAKCWPHAHFAALASALRDRGFQVCIVGGPADRPAGDSIVAASDGAATNLCGETTLAQAVDLLAGCEIAVTNDSGLMHMAAAVGTHVIALYGSTSPDFTPPLTTAADVLTLALDCSPCFKRECPLGHLNCLQQLTPQMVLARTLAATE
ncbi:MAG: lipopolysaccharide heptosyltransferase II [Pseudomonadota bacterium]